MRIIVEELKYRERKRMECGKGWNNEYDLVFTNATGEPVGIGSLTYSRKKLKQICEVSVKDFLSIKNNFALMALKQGVNPADLKIYLGYRSYETIAVMAISNDNIRGETESLFETLHERREER